MSKKLKKRRNRIIAGAAVFAAAVIVSHFWEGVDPIIELILFVIAYFVIGGDIVRKAVMNIGRGRVFDENFLMTVATIGAFLVGEYPEAVAVMLFYQVGELFQAYAVGRSRKSIAELMDIRPDYANVMRGGETIQVAPEEVAIGETIIVKPGERIPLDGSVIKGNTTLDTKALTGESLPREAAAGDSVISGCVSLSGVIEVEVNKYYGESTVSRILHLVENAAEKKAETENFITKFAGYYTPIVVIGAVLLAVLPPLFLQGDWSEWIYRALTFLVISCPCALVISIPLSFFGGIGGAGKAGILVKGSNYLEALAQTESVVMDKTGTLTRGNFKVSQIITANAASDREELLELTAHAESYSSHPISLSLQEAYGQEIDQSRVSDIEEAAGLGIQAKVDGRPILAGNSKLMEKYGITYSHVKEIGTIVHVAVESSYAGYIVIADEIKADSQAAIQALKEAGVKQIVMLTGDRRETAEQVAAELRIPEVYAELLPGDKVDRLEELLQQKSEKGKLAFAGDGINDAPVLARADIGIAMGGLGSDAAIEAADIVIMTDEPSKIAKAIQIARKTLRIVKQNIVFALGIKLLVLLLAAIGMTSMWAAVFADVGVAMIAILNAMRAMRVK